MSQNGGGGAPAEASGHPEGARGGRPKTVTQAFGPKGPLWYQKMRLTRDLCGGVSEWNHNPSPMGQVPKQINALARISTTHYYAPLRTTTHHYALYALCAWHLGAFLNPGPWSLFHITEINTSQKSRLVQCQETLVAVHVEATSAFRAWRHCTWEFFSY